MGRVFIKNPKMIIQLLIHCIRAGVVLKPVKCITKNNIIYPI